MQLLLCYNACMSFCYCLFIFLAYCSPYSMRFFKMLMENEPYENTMHGFQNFVFQNKTLYLNSIFPWTYWRPLISLKHRWESCVPWFSSRVCYMVHRRQGKCSLRTNINSKEEEYRFAFCCLSKHLSFDLGILLSQ